MLCGGFRLEYLALHGVGEASVFSGHSPLYQLRQAPSLNLEPADLLRLASQLAPGTSSPWRSSPLSTRVTGVLPCLVNGGVPGDGPRSCMESI